MKSTTNRETDILISELRSNFYVRFIKNGLTAREFLELFDLTSSDIQELQEVDAAD